MINVSTIGNGRFQSRAQKTFLNLKIEIPNHHIMRSDAFPVDPLSQLTITHHSSISSNDFSRFNVFMSSKNFTRCRRKCLRLFTVRKSKRRQWKNENIIIHLQLWREKCEKICGCNCGNVLKLCGWMSKYLTFALQSSFHFNRISSY